MRFVFAQWPEVQYQGIVLTHEGANDRLLSYAFTRELNDSFLSEFVSKGYVEGKE